MIEAFSHLIGNDPIKGYLTRMIERDAVGNALLFSGPDGVGKRLFAEAFAGVLLGTPDILHHPDVHIYRPEGKVGLHSIESMRQFSEQVYLSSYKSPWKIFIIHDADRMLTYSANALLKTFEEPSPDSIILLISHAPESLLSTVVSRCRHIPFQPIEEAEIARFLQEQKGIEAEAAEQYASFSHGSLGSALQIASGTHNEAKQIITDTLIQGKVSDYAQLSQLAKRLSETLESEEGDGLRSEHYKGDFKDLSSFQQNAINKEIDGALRMKKKKEATSLFLYILSWYRDITLLQIGADPRYLFHKDKQQDLQMMKEKEATHTLEFIQKAVQESLLAYERSTSLNLCLENLFLKMGIL